MLVLLVCKKIDRNSMSVATVEMRRQVRRRDFREVRSEKLIMCRRISSGRVVRVGIVDSYADTVAVDIGLFGWWFDDLIT